MATNIVNAVVPLTVCCVGSAYRVLFTLFPSVSGDGGNHKHYGPTYLGLQPPPVALCLNLFNVDYRQPQNSWAQNPTACQRLYDETLAIINAKASKQISPVDMLAKQKA
jgi:hypothetical protein